MIDTMMLHELIMCTYIVSCPSLLSVAFLFFPHSLSASLMYRLPELASIASHPAIRRIPYQRYYITSKTFDKTDNIHLICVRSWSGV